MEFFFGIAMLAAAPALLAAAVSAPIFFLKKPYAKPLAVVVGIALFAFFAWAGFVILIVEAARQGHPF